MKANRGFTLVEILIVVVILGILAAIVIPQFTQASSEAKTNSLCSDLQTLRSQVELYKCQHNDVNPSLANFEDQMIYTSDIAGAFTATKVRDATHTFGPYLERVPENPFTNSDSVVDWGASATTDGWEYNATTGEIRAAIDTVDPNAHQAL
jgi:general secretion pathway protein G